MSDIKIGDKVVGIKGATRVAGIVMNIKEGHVHIKSPVSGVYAPVVNIVPLHKVTKLGEGAMKRKSEDEDHSGMDDYLAHEAEKNKNKKKEVKEDKAKAVTNKNQEHAVHIAGQAVTAYPNAHQAQRVGLKLKDMLGKKTVSVHHMGEEVEQIDETSTGKKLGAASVRLGKGAAAAALHVASTPLAGLAGFPGKNAVRKVGDASLKLHNKAYDAAKKHLGKGIKHLGALEESHSIVNNLKAEGKHEEAGAKAFEHGLGRKYGQHFGLRSTKDKDEASFHRGYDHAEAKSKKVQEGIVSTVKKFIKDYKNYKNPSPQKDYREDPKKAEAARKTFFENPEQIDEKSMYKNQAVKMTAHTEKGGKVYKGTHTVILKKVPTLDTPTIQAQTKERAEKSLKAHLKSRGHTVTGIEHLGEGYNSARTHGTAYDRRDISGRGSFKSREHEFEAGVEDRIAAEKRERDSQPHHIIINGRVKMNNERGRPHEFNNLNHATAYANAVRKNNPTANVEVKHFSELQGK